MVGTDTNGLIKEALGCRIQPTSDRRLGLIAIKYAAFLSMLLSMINSLVLTEQDRQETLIA